MVEFKSVFNEKKVDVVNQRNFSKMKSIFLIFLVVFAFLGILMICIAYEEFLEKEEAAISDLIFGIVLLIVGVLYYPMTKWVAKRYQNKINKTMSLLSGETEEVFKFDDEKIFIYTTKGEDYRSAVETNYKYINNIVETNDHYLLYVSKVQCHVLDKKDLVSGSFEELNKIFQKHFGDERFVREVKKVLYEK